MRAHATRPSFNLGLPPSTAHSKFLDVTALPPTLSGASITSSSR
jgi:hypothetical protein